MHDEKKDAESTVPIPEEFQKSVKSLLKGANKQQLSFVRDCCCECESDSKEAMMSTEGMP